MNAGSPLSTRPGCLFCLVQATPSMLRACREGSEEPRKLTLVCRGVEVILRQLLELHHRGIERVGNLSVAVIAYCHNSEGKLSFTPLLRETGKEPFLIHLTDLISREIDASEPKAPSHRLDSNLYHQLAEQSIDQPAASAALAYALHLTSRWLVTHADAWPAVILHFSDGEICDDHLMRSGRSLQLLGSASGSIGLAHLIFSEKVGRSVHGQRPSSPESCWQRLWELSSRISSSTSDMEERRALWVNANPWPVVERLLRETACQPVDPRDDGSPACVWMRALWYVKKGNAEQEWEDAFAFDASRAVAAICDGASQGIFARLWARQLAEAFVADQPNFQHSADLLAWVRGHRAAWLREINNRPGGLRWSQQEKVERDGASATLTTLQISINPQDNAIYWCAWAVGDSCLFWVRDNQLLASFPIAATRHFVLGPALLRTKLDSSPNPLRAKGRCLPGDLFLLATDAVAELLLRQVENGQPPDWNQFEVIEEGAWRQQLDSQREQRQMVNDDCTLVVVRVLPPMNSTTEGTTQPGG